MGGGPGTQTSTLQQSRNLPGFEQEIGRALVGAASNYVFPGMKVPGNTWFPGNTGFSFPGGGPTAAGGVGAMPGGTGAPAGQSGLAQFLGQGPGQLDPNVAANFVGPAIGGSPFLQNIAAQNPGAITGAFSPLASGQLFNYPFLYGGMPGNPDPAFANIYGPLASGGSMF